MALKYIFKLFLIPFHLNWNLSRYIRDVFAALKIPKQHSYILSLFQFLFSCPPPPKSTIYFPFHFPQLFHPLRESNKWMKQFVTNQLARKVVLMSKNNICKPKAIVKNSLMPFILNLSFFGMKMLFKNWDSQIPLGARKQKYLW